MNRLRFGSLAVAVAFGLQSAPAQQPYQVLDHWKIGGTGGWDYLLADSAAHRLYVTHNSRVEVLDTQTGAAVGAISGLKGTHGVALDDAGQFGYISDGGANAVVVFDRKTLATVATIPAGTNPDGITFEPVTKTVWAFNGRSNNVTVIDTASRSVIATIALPGKPEFPQPDGQGHVFANIEDKNSIVALDSRTKALTATWKLSNCESPSGLAIDRAHSQLFAVCDEKKMAVVDTKTGKQVGTAAIGDGPDAAAFDPKHQLAFASSGDGVLTVVDTSSGFKTIESLPTMKGARTMAYDEAADRAYVVSAEMGARPAATAANPRPRPAILPDTFQVLVIGRK
ncbi:YncE family protein [Terriglobus aquaticus]|uniref:YncE family protein n=1 Tax=Terriglobus aquaticus TaxID=940139 RepID=A0ABW9KL08_9BACT|nr:YncE family protein [Terriglobus aquaticus]